MENGYTKRESTENIEGSKARNAHIGKTGKNRRSYGEKADKYNDLMLEGVEMMKLKARG